MSNIETTIDKAISATPDTHKVYRFYVFGTEAYTTSLDCANIMLMNDISITVLIRHHIRGWEIK
jgi:hypothetical protein